VPDVEAAPQPDWAAMSWEQVEDVLLDATIQRTQRQVEVKQLQAALRQRDHYENV
jgi:hypothetical protein